MVSKNFDLTSKGVINLLPDSNDPKLLLNNSGLGLISQQLHHLNGFSSNLNKLHPPELQRMSMQQLQFLQTQLQRLPTLLTPPSLYTKFPDPKNHLSMLIQARKQHPKILEGDLDNVKKDVFRSLSTKLEDSNPVKAAAVGKERKDEVALKIGKPQEDENMDVDNYEDNVSESDELLSVGSVSPPPPPPPPPSNCIPRANSTELSDPGLSTTLDSSSTSCSVLSNRTVDPSGVLAKKPPANNPPVRLQNGLTNAKTTNATNRTLKFSIDNILKSDFGNEETVKKAKGGDSGKREKESERTTAVKKKPETEKETETIRNTYPRQQFTLIKNIKK